MIYSFLKFLVVVPLGGGVGGESESECGTHTQKKNIISHKITAQKTREETLTTGKRQSLQFRSRYDLILPFAFLHFFFKFLFSFSLQFRTNNKNTFVDNIPSFSFGF